MPKIETRGRKRIGTEVTVPYACAIDPKLKEALENEAYRDGKTLSQMGAYALQRFINEREIRREILREE